MLEHGVPFRLNSRVRRLVAPNPSVMTGAGTNTYLLGDKDVAVLDPGPAIPEHIEAILASAGGNIRWIICTHTHPDHSPAWQAVASATGAQVIGALPANDRLQDDTFQPDWEILHEEVLATDEFTLRALHTPGHVSNHFCFLLEEEGMLFAGDHVMNGSTVVIIPPGGDMKAYIESLRLLLDYPIQTIAPGHGEVITESAQELQGLVEHRLKREAKVVAGLEQLGRCDLDALVQVVYDDVDESIHEWAKLSMTAHLIKLEQEGRASADNSAGTWKLSP